MIKDNESRFSKNLRKYINEIIPEIYLKDEDVAKKGLYPSIYSLLSNDKNEPNDTIKEHYKCSSYEQLYQTFAYKNVRPTLKSNNRQTWELKLKHLQYLCDVLKIDPNTVLADMNHDYNTSYEWIDEKSFYTFVELVKKNMKASGTNKTQKIRVAYDSISEIALYIKISPIEPRRKTISLEESITKFRIDEYNFNFIFNYDLYSKYSFEEEKNIVVHYAKLTFKKAIEMFDYLKYEFRNTYIEHLQDLLSYHDDQLSDTTMKGNSLLYPKSCLSSVIYDLDMSNLEANDLFEKDIIEIAKQKFDIK